MQTADQSSDGLPLNLLMQDQSDILETFVKVPMGTANFEVFVRRFVETVKSTNPDIIYWEGVPSNPGSTKMATATPKKRTIN